MIHAFFLAVGQLPDRPVLLVLLKSLALTLLLFLGLGVGLWFAMDRLAGATGEWLGLGADRRGARGCRDIAAVRARAGGCCSARSQSRWWASSPTKWSMRSRRNIIRPRMPPHAHVPLGRSIAMGLGSAARAIG